MDKEALYTLRWLVNNKWGQMEFQEEADKIITNIIGDGKNTVNNESRPSAGATDAKKLWCPFADINFKKSTTRGEYPKKYPEGAIVHFTAGRRNGLSNGLEYQANQGYTYFLIDKDGNIGQNFPLNKWGYHSGESYWEGVGQYVHRRLVGIEIQCAGNLDKNNKSWFGVSYPQEETRNIAAKFHNISPGRYLKYTDKQEEALVNLLIWLKNNNTSVFSFDWVLGHDEVSPGRKVDPGGSLSMTMPVFRDFLKKKYKEIHS